MNASKYIRVVLYHYYGIKSFFESFNKMVREKREEVAVYYF